MYSNMTLSTNGHNIHFMFSLISSMMMILFRWMGASNTFLRPYPWHFSISDRITYFSSRSSPLRILNSMSSKTFRFLFLAMCCFVSFLAMSFLRCFSCLTLIIFPFYPLPLRSGLIFLHSSFCAFLAPTSESTFLGTIFVKVRQWFILLAKSTGFHFLILTKTRPLAIARKCHLSSAKGHWLTILFDCFPATLNRRRMYYSITSRV